MRCRTEEGLSLPSRLKKDLYVACPCDFSIFSAILDSYVNLTP